MKNADQPAYPFIAGDQSNPDDRALCEGLSKREKLAMEIYARELSGIPIQDEKRVTEAADLALRAADIFFEQLNK